MIKNDGVRIKFMLKLSQYSIYKDKQYLSMWRIPTGGEGTLCVK